MSSVVICDECGRLVKHSGALHCYDAATKINGKVYGADICKECLPLFVKKYDVYGWHLSYKKEERGDNGND